MTRALIADPELPPEGCVEGRTRRSSAASAATPASRTTTPARRSRCAVNPRTGRERRLGPSWATRAPPQARRRRRRARRHRRRDRDAGRAGHEVVLLEPSESPRRPDRPGRSGSGRPRARARASSRTPSGGSPPPTSTCVSERTVRTSSRPTGSCSPRAHVPYRDDGSNSTGGSVHAWDVLGGELPDGRAGPRRGLGRRPERPRRGRSARRGGQAR